MQGHMDEVGDVLVRPCATDVCMCAGLSGIVWLMWQFVRANCFNEVVTSTAHHNAYSIFSCSCKVATLSSHELCNPSH